MNQKVLIFFYGAFLTSFSLFANNSQANNSQIKQQVLAVQLANLGYAEKDPILLMAAAKLVKKQPLQSIRLSKQQVKQESTKTDSKKKTNNKLKMYSADTLLNQAEQYAGGKAELVLLIQDLRSFTSRGLADGAKMHKDEVLANGFDYYKLTFEADAIAKVGVISDDSQQDLDLYVVDALEQDKVVCQDTSAATGSLCEWMPNKEQDYIIKIKNRSTAISAYTMILN